MIEFTRAATWCRAIVWCVLPVLCTAAPELALGQNGGSTDPWHELSGFEAGTNGGGGGGGGPVDPHAVLRAAQAEVRLGRPDRALSILSRYPLPESMAGGAPLAITAMARLHAGRFREAADLFLRASGYADRFKRGVWEARAGDSYEKAGMVADAHETYLLAATRVREASDWLLIRAARTASDTDFGLATLENTSPETRVFALRTQGRYLLRTGAIERGVEMLAESGATAEAAQIALMHGDSSEARSWTYLALLDPNERTRALDLATGPIPPTSSDEFRALATALRQTGSPRAAVEAAEGAVVTGDSLPSLLLFEGEILEVTGNRGDAIEAYRAAALRRGRLQIEAQYRLARALVRAGRRREAYPALLNFVQSHPDHSRASAALFLMADLRDDQGQITSADSLYRLVHERWPESDFASDARTRLARMALARRDTLQAMDWLTAEVAYQGSRENAANFQLAGLYRTLGDVSGSRRVLTDLARSDSIGYYGMLARSETDLGPLRFAQVGEVEVTETMGRRMRALDLLDEAGFVEEADLLVSALLARNDLTFAEILDLGEGLIARGRARTAVTLGWRIARLHSLNHPRVLRIIFPWPNQHLVEREANKFGVDPFLLAGLIRRESAFDEDATSSAGARGMTQLMPETARWLAGRLGVDWDPLFLGVAGANIHVGAAHLSDMLRSYEGQPVPALAAYNAGGSRVRRWLRFPEAGDWVAFTERIPFNETRVYVREVLRNRAVYEGLYGGVMSGAQ